MKYSHSFELIVKCDAMNGSEEGKAGSHTDHCRKILFFCSAKNDNESHFEVSNVTYLLIDAICYAVSEKLFHIKKLFKLYEFFIPFTIYFL